MDLWYVEIRQVEIVERKGFTAEALRVPGDQVLEELI
jgi:hypothetical protein